MRDEILDFWGDRDYGGCFETSWDFALAERVTVEFTEACSQLFCTELQCRWARSFPDLQFPEEVPHLGLSSFGVVADAETKTSLKQGCSF